MANVVASRILNDGPRNYVVWVNMEADGSGDEVHFPIAQASQADCDHFTIKSIKGTVLGEFGLRLDFDGATKVPFLNTQVPSVPGQTESLDLDYYHTGGIPDPQMANYTGDIVLSTDGFTAAGDAAQFQIHMTKHQ